MLRRGGLIALVLALAAGEAKAQFVPPYPIPVLIPNGFGFSYRSGPLRVGGFFGNGSYSLGTWYPPGVNPAFVGPIPAVPYYLPLSSAIDYRVSYNFITPRIVMVPGPFPPLTSQYDLSGVDLDLVAVKKEPNLPAAGNRLARDDPPAKNPPKVAAAKPQPKPVEVANLAKPEPAAEKVARVVAAPERPLPRFELPPPKAAPLEEADRLMELGQAAFRQGEFGVAAKRFLQAREVDPAAGRTLFYLAQAHFALGKYQDAVRALEEGLKLTADWPRSTFRPRTDLYRGIGDDWQRHRELLEAMVKRHPKEPAYVLLLAHQLWFDDQRAEAIVLFRRASGLVQNSPLIDTFLAQK